MTDEGRTFLHTKFYEAGHNFATSWLEHFIYAAPDNSPTLALLVREAQEYDHKTGQGGHQGKELVWNSIYLVNRYKASDLNHRQFILCRTRGRYKVIVVFLKVR